MSFALVVGDNWYSYMFDTIRAYSSYSRAYFLIVVYLCNLTLINVFTAILINTFGEESEKIRKNMKKTKSNTIDYEQFWMLKIRKFRPKIQKFIEKNYILLSKCWENVIKVVKLANFRFFDRKSVFSTTNNDERGSIFPLKRRYKNKKPEKPQIIDNLVKTRAKSEFNYNLSAGILSIKPSPIPKSAKSSLIPLNRWSILGNFVPIKNIFKRNIRKPSELLYKNENKTNIFLSIELSYKNNIVDFKAFNEKVKSYRKDRKTATPNTKKSQNLTEEYDFLSKLKADFLIKLEGISLNFFKKDDKFRVFCSKILNNPFFETFILILIIVSCILLAATDPISDPNSQFNSFLFIYDIILAVVFLIEILMKIIVHGLLFNGDNSYLRTGWHVFDFFISFFFILATFEAIQLKLTALKSLRFARILRPLRLISKNEGLKLTINSFLMAIPTLFNLILLVFSFFYITSVFLVSNFKGSFHYCSIDNQYNNNAIDKYSCFDYGGDWVNQDMNMDNVWNAMASLLAISTTDNWTGVMFNMMDSVAPEVSPIENNSIIWQYFSMIFMSLSTFVVLNLFTSLVVDSYQREKDKGIGIARLTFRQKEWIKLQMRIFNMPPKFNVIFQ